ncbi:MAG: hypothetical protein ACYC1D_05655 [Acidimicrobiales bacterium]
MGGPFNPNNPLVVSAFHTRVVNQVFVLLILVALTPLALRLLQRSRWMGSVALDKGPSAAEPPGRTVLRIGFSALWILDGALQLQPAMPLGLPLQVIQPSEAGNPSWLRDAVEWGSRLWQYHPVAFA